MNAASALPLPPARSIHSQTLYTPGLCTPGHLVHTLCTPSHLLSSSPSLAITRLDRCHVWPSASGCGSTCRQPAIPPSSALLSLLLLPLTLRNDVTAKSLSSVILGPNASLPSFPRWQGQARAEIRTFPLNAEKKVHQRNPSLQWYMNGLEPAI